MRRVRYLPLILLILLAGCSAARPAAAPVVKRVVIGELSPVRAFLLVEPESVRLLAECSAADTVESLQFKYGRPGQPMIGQMTAGFSAPGMQGVKLYEMDRDAAISLAQGDEIEITMTVQPKGGAARIINQVYGRHPSGDVTPRP
jgi:hypothetical protein